MWMGMRRSMLDTEEEDAYLIALWPLSSSKQRANVSSLPVPSCSCCRCLPTSGACLPAHRSLSLNQLLGFQLFTSSTPYSTWTSWHSRRLSMLLSPHASTMINFAVAAFIYHRACCGPPCLQFSKVVVFALLCCYCSDKLIDKSHFSPP